MSCKWGKDNNKMRKTKHTSVIQQWDYVKSNLTTAAKYDDDKNPNKLPAVINVQLSLVFVSLLEWIFILEMLLMIAVFFFFKCGELRSIQEVSTDIMHKSSIVFSPTLLLENYQPWLDLKVNSKVDASIAEVPHWMCEWIHTIYISSDMYLQFEFGNHLFLYNHFLNYMYRLTYFWLTLSVAVPDL